MKKYLSLEHNRLTNKISGKFLNPTSFHNLSSENVSPMPINGRKKQDSEQNRLINILTAPSRCCRSCRTQRRLATIAQRSINIYKVLKTKN